MLAGQRLSFEQAGMQGPALLPAQDILAAVSGPSVPNFLRAVDQLVNAASSRFEQLERAQQPATRHATGQSVKVLKEHFSSLKNSWTQSEVRDTFLDALAEGRPGADEAERLQSTEQQIAEHSRQVKHAKQSNAQVETRLLQTIDQISKQHASLDHMQGSATAQLQCLEEEMAQESVEAPSLPELPAGPSTAECRAELAAELAQRTKMDTSLASLQAEQLELQAAIASEEQEVAALQAQVAAQEAALAQSQSSAGADSSFRAALDWCQGMAGLLASLSGVRLLDVAPDCLRMRLTTAAGSQKVDHLLLLRTLKGSFVAADLVPSDVPLDSDSIQPGTPIHLVVQSVQAQIADQLSRKQAST